MLPKPTPGHREGVSSSGVHPLRGPAVPWDRVTIGEIHSLSGDAHSDLKQDTDAIKGDFYSKTLQLQACPPPGSPATTRQQPHSLPGQSMFWKMDLAWSLLRKARL